MRLHRSSSSPSLLSFSAPRPLALAALASLAACASSTSVEPSAPTPPSSDDAGAVAPASTCDLAALPASSFALDAAGPDGQIHSIAALGGDRIFIAYNRPKASAKTFDVYLTALTCDGASAFDPVLVTDDDENDVDPSIAVQPDAIMVTWAGSTSGKEPNLHLRSRVFGRDGVARGAARVFEGPRAGVATTKFNIWQGSVAPHGDGFALAGAWGIEEAPAFQTFVARLDATGAPSGDALDLGVDAATTQTGVDVSSGAATGWATWLVQPNAGEGQSVATATFAMSGASTRGPTIENAASPSVATLGTTAWVSAQRGESDVVLQRLDAKGGPVVLAGKGSQPALALSTSGGAFAAYRAVGPGRTIVVTRVDASGAALGEVDVTLTDAAPYPMRLIRVVDDVYFLAYQRGKGNALRAMGRFIDFRAL